MTHNACYIAFAGSAWHKAALINDAIRGVLAETAYENVAAVSIWRITFREPVDSLECVIITPTGSVNYPAAGAELKKSGRLPIPPAVASAARAFEGAMQQWHDDVLDEQFEEPVAA